MTTHTLSEADKGRLVPGIHFMDEPAGRCAKVPGTGLGVWEVIQGYIERCDHDEHLLAREYDWLSSAQLRAALDYYGLFPAEIEARLALEDRYTPGYLRELFGDRFIG